MASKKRQSKKNSGAGNPAKSAQRGRSVYCIQVEQHVDSPREDYAAWVATTVPAFSPEDAAAAANMRLFVIGAVGTEYAQKASSSNLRDIDIDLFGEALAEHLMSIPETMAPEPIFSSWLDYLSFLEENKLWEGAPENFEALREMLEDTLDGFAEGDAEICELLRGTELFTKVKAFGLALGDGVDMSDDSEAGIQARTRVLLALGLDPQSFDTEGPAPLVFTYIWGAARLSVVDFDGPTMNLDEESYDLMVDGDQAASAQILFEMAVGCVQAHLNPTFDVTLRDEAHYLVAAQPAGHRLYRTRWRSGRVAPQCRAEELRRRAARGPGRHGISGPLRPARQGRGNLQHRRTPGAGHLCGHHRGRDLLRRSRISQRLIPAAAPFCGYQPM
ncbi:hypothetical protein AAHB37_18635 [Glutamicibacter halophytocola]|uniref:hypothetical protein n=1 Tax=Glutamicibacter halophytocola TaxID=1933880 RepID=UPI00321B79CA